MNISYTCVLLMFTSQKSLLVLDHDVSKNIVKKLRNNMFYLSIAFSSSPEFLISKINFFLFVHPEHKGFYGSALGVRHQCDPIAAIALLPGLAVFGLEHVLCARFSLSPSCLCALFFFSSSSGCNVLLFLCLLRFYAHTHNTERSVNLCYLLACDPMIRLRRTH